MAGQAATGADAEEAEEPTTARSSAELKWREKHSIDLSYVCRVAGGRVCSPGFVWKRIFSPE